MRRAASSLFALALCSCASGGATVEQLLARELAAGATREVVDPRETFHARVEALAVEFDAPPDDEAKPIGADLQIGTDSPIRCHFYPDDKDLAGSLELNSAANFEAMEAIAPIPIRRILGVDAGAIGSVPFMAMQWLFRFGDEPLQLKLAIATKQGRAILCKHVELGYAGSFARIFQGLVESFEVVEDSRPLPYFTEIATIRSQQMRVGVNWTTMLRDDQGDTRVEMNSAMLLPTGPDTLSSTDSLTIHWSKPDGSLINAYAFGGSAGEQTMDLKLAPDGEVWRVQGTFQGKPIEREIARRGTITSSRGEYLALREQLAPRGPTETVVLQQWIPDADPTRFLEVRLETLERLDAGRSRARYRMEHLEFDVTRDAAGLPESGRIELGGNAFEMERAYQDGLP
jgi:hypothetical protein